MSKTKKTTAENVSENVSTEETVDEIAHLRQQLEMANARAAAMEAQVAARAAMEAMANITAEGLEMVHLINLTDTEVHAAVTDRYGGKRNLVWKSRGEAHPLTTIQFEELKENAPNLFTRGLIGTEVDIDTNPNYIGPVDEFLADLDLDDIAPRINMVTELSALMRVFHELESWRRIDSDADGRPLTTVEGEPVVRFRDFSIPQKLLMDAVIARVAKLSGVQLQTSDG